MMIDLSFHRNDLFDNRTLRLLISAQGLPDIFNGKSCENYRGSDGFDSF